MPAPGAIHRHNVGPNFSEAVVHDGVVYLAGQVALENAGGAIREQVDEVLRRVDALLTDVSSGRDRLLSALVLLTNAADLPLFNEAWAEWLPPGEAPARTTFVTSLVSPDFLIEITVTAAVLPASASKGE